VKGVKVSEALNKSHRGRCRDDRSGLNGTAISRFSQSVTRHPALVDPFKDNLGGFIAFEVAFSNQRELHKVIS